MKSSSLFWANTWVAITLLSLPIYLQAQTNLVVKHYQKQVRYQFVADLLHLALSKFDTPFEIIAPATQKANEGRGELLVISGKLDLQWMSTSRGREEKMIAVKVPIYQGILGLRLLLVTKQNHQALSQISSISDLRHYTGGHGSHWHDLPVYAANKLKVNTYGNYQTLFTQLEHNRFDYFHRGLNEIWQEQATHADKLKIADNVMLFYPHPVYYFVNKDRPNLAQKIEEGLRMALMDGSFKKLFLSAHNDIIKKAKLAKRKLIVLKNPVVPSSPPKFNTQWWLPKKFQKHIIQPL